MSDLMTEQEIFDYCYNHVIYTTLSANNHTLAIDGTSCTKKSSILNATGRMYTKVQRNNNIQNPDTYGPSMIGYISSGIMDNYCGGPHFCDRSPLNVMDWHLLWKFMDDFLVRFGNVDPNDELPTNTVMQHSLDEYCKAFKLYRQKESVEAFAKHINCIVLIDTDTQRCDELRIQRNDNPTDVLRSTWKFYTYLQNLMYKTLYPDLYIDLAWFRHAETDVVVAALAKFFNFVLDYIVDHVKSNFMPFPKYSLPTIKHDYNLSNISVHAYRSIGRWGCKLLTGETDKLDVRIPSYLKVDNILHPHGHMHNSIIPKSRRFLFDSDNNIDMDNNDDGNDEDNDNNMFTTKMAKSINQQDEQISINISSTYLENNIPEASYNELF